MESIIPTVEYTLESHSRVKSVAHFENGPVEFIQIKTKSGQTIGLGLGDGSNSSKEYSVEIDGQLVSWTGPYKLFHSDVHLEGNQ